MRLADRDISPRFATYNKELMNKAQQIRADFLDAYQTKRQRWVKNGGEVVFPCGTVQLRSRAPISCEPPDPGEPGLLALVEDE